MKTTFAVLLALAIVLLALPVAAHDSHAAGFETSNTWIKGTAEGRENSACKQAKAKAEEPDNLRLPSDHYLESSQCACWHLDGKTQCKVAFVVKEKPAVPVPQCPTIAWENGRRVTYECL